MMGIVSAAVLARVAALVERLEARVAEAADAASRGDASWLQAALRAYARIATEAAAGPTPGAAAAVPLAIRVREQLQVIAGLGAGDPATVAAREQARLAARALLGVLGMPDDDGPGPGSSGGSADPRASVARRHGGRDGWIVWLPHGPGT